MPPSDPTLPPGIGPALSNFSRIPKTVVHVGFEQSASGDKTRDGNRPLPTTRARPVLNCAGIWIALLAGFCYGAEPPAEGLSRGDRYSGAPWVTRSPVLAQHGMAATEQPLASPIAIDILKQGGRAVDAAIATNAALGLMEPVLNGIGGDCFAIVWDPKTRRLYGYNGSG